jgi:hypothetical protein
MGQSGSSTRDRMYSNVTGMDHDSSTLRGTQKTGQSQDRRCFGDGQQRENNTVMHCLMMGICSEKCEC